MTAVATPPTKPRSRLSKVQKGRLRLPLRYIVYGPEGVGKTTLAADAPDPIWFDIEDGSSRVSVARYDFHDGPNGHVPTTYAEVVAGIDDLTNSEHQFKTLVIDTADRLESLVWKSMLERDSQPSAQNGKAKVFGSIEDYGYGKGYNMAVEEWRALCARLDRLRAVRQMSVVMIAHAQIRPFKNPEGEDFDRYQLRIHDKAAGFLKEWADVTGFARFEDGAGKAPGAKTERPKGFSTGRRLLMLSRTAAFDAKSRINLPDEVEIAIEHPWSALAEAVEAGYQDEAKSLEAQIAVEVERIGDPDTAAKVATAVKEAVTANDTAALSRFLVGLKGRPSKSEVQQ
jgi:hypothetical protein